jgi:Domain of unknown function (DUF4397)
MNASPDQPSLDAFLGSKTLATSVAYATSSNYSSQGSGSPTLKVTVAGNTNSLLSQTITLPAGGNATVIAANFSADLAAIVLADDNSAPTSGNFKMRILNLSPALGPADVYIIPAGTDLTTVAPQATSLGFEAASVYFSLSAGTYDVIFTLPGQKFISVDSGTLNLAAGQVRTVAAINSQFGGVSATTLNDVN